MMPGFRSNKPGKDTMGMDLVPVYAGEVPSGPAGTVAVSPETVQQIGVKTTVVKRKLLRRDVRTIGRIDYDESLVTDVAPKIGGWVEEQYVNFPGQMVRKGQALGTIYSPELVATEQEYLNALKYRGQLKNTPLEDASSGAQNLVQAVETRLRYWNITDAQIRALKQRGKIHQRIRIERIAFGPFYQRIPQRGHILAVESHFHQSGKPQEPCPAAYFSFHRFPWSVNFQNRSRHRRKRRCRFGCCDD